MVVVVRYNLIHAQADQHILGLDVSVHDTAHAVQVVHADQHLLRDRAALAHRERGPLQLLRQVAPQYLEHHHVVHAEGALMRECVQQAHDVVLLGGRHAHAAVLAQRLQPRRVGALATDGLQHLDLVQGLRREVDHKGYTASE